MRLVGSIRHAVQHLLGVSIPTCGRSSVRPDHPGMTWEQAIMVSIPTSGRQGFQRRPGCPAVQAVRVVSIPTSGRQGFQRRGEAPPRPYPHWVSIPTCGRSSVRPESFMPPTWITRSTNGFNPDVREIIHATWSSSPAILLTAVFQSRRAGDHPCDLFRQRI